MATANTANSSSNTVTSTSNTVSSNTVSSNTNTQNTSFVPTSLNTYGLSYEWKLTSMKVSNIGTLANVITSVSWTVKGTDSNGYTGTFNGVTPLSAPDANNFIQLSSMSANNVVSMIQGEIANNLSYIQHIDDQIYNQIKVNYVQEATLEGNTLPWSANTYSI